MLDIILRVLMVTGIVLLVLLAVFLAAVCLVLFVPITYKVFGKKNGEGIQLQVKADWMLGLIRLRFAYPKPGNVTVKGLWFLLYDSNPEAASKTEAEAKSEAVLDAKSRADSDSEVKVKAEAESDSETRLKAESDAEAKTTFKAEEKLKAESASEAKSKTEEASETESETGSQAETESQSGTETGSQSQSDSDSEPVSEKKGFVAYFFDKFSKIKKIRYTITELYAKIKDIFKNIAFYRDLFQNEQTQALLRHGMFRLGRILKSIRPKKIRGNILFGTGAPDTTGYAFGIYGMISAWLGNDICVTPDFTQAILEGEFYAAGHITLLQLLWHGLRVILDRRLRLLLKRIKTHTI